MEIYPTDYNSGEFQLADLDNISRELAELAGNPTDNDPRIAAFAEAALYCLARKDDDRLRLSLQFMLDYRSDPDTDSAGGKKEEPFTPQYAANLLLRSFQHTILFVRKYPIFSDTEPSDVQDYPRVFDYPAAWVREIDTVLSNSSAHGVLDFDLAHRRIQSNIADRYKGPKLILLRDYPDRFTGPINMLDVGASLNFGLTKLVTQSSFRPVDVLSVLPSEGDAIVDAENNLLINALINRPISINSAVGVDILPMWDPNTREWVRSCSFYPSELLDKSKTQEFDLLDRANETLDSTNRQKAGHKYFTLNLPDLSHFVGDFSDRKSMRKFEPLLPEEKFQVVSFLTVMHQLSDREVTSMIGRAKQYLSDDGLIIVQDFANVNPRAPNNLEFPTRWSEYMYKTIVIDPSQGSSPRESIIWDYGRCKKAILV